MSVVIRAMRHTDDPDGYVYDLPKQIAAHGWPLRGDKSATYHPTWSPDHGAHIIRKNEIRPLINLLSHAGVEYLYVDNPAWEPGGRFRP